MQKPVMHAVCIAILYAMLVASGAASAGSNTSDFGLGLMVGEPTGLSAKVWTGSTNAFDFGLAWSTSKHSSVAIHGDYVRHKFDAIDVEEGALPFYYGIGVRLLNRDNADDNIGVRFPIGLDYLFAQSSFDVFLEVVPIMDLTPDSEFDINVGLGARYFF